MYGPSSPHRRSRAGLWFAAFTIASLLMLLASSTEPAQTLQRVTTRALDPVRQTLTGIGSGVAGLFGTIGEIDRLRGENADLRVALAGAEQRIAELAEAARENGELRQLLGITEALDMELLPVRITSRDPSNFTWEAGVRVMWTVNDTFATAPAVAEAKARTVMVAEQKTLLREALQLEVASAYTDMKKAVSSIEAAERGLTAAEESLRVRSELFKSGRATSVDLIDAETEVTRGRLRRLDAHVGLLVAKTRLDHATGRDVREVKDIK